jgi:copper chaperone
MRREILRVPDISCEHCQRSIEAAVAELPGVARVAVAIADKTVEVEFDESRTDREAVVGAIESQGYEVPTG